MDVGEIGAAPRLAVDSLGCVSASEPGLWRARWRIVNQDEEDCWLAAAWHPHGKFRGAPQDLEPPWPIPGASAVEIETSAACREPAGTVVENGFLILRVNDAANRTWRYFARLRVEVGADGVPVPRVEVVSVQRAGFSGTATPGSED